MKIKRLFYALLCSLLLLTGCESTEMKDYEEIEITYEELQEKIKNKETFVVEVFRDKCPHCEKVAHYVEETKQEHPNVVLYRIDCTNWELQNNEDGTALESTSEIGKKFLEEYSGFFYTPTFYAFEKGEVVVSAVGFSELSANVCLWEVDSVVDFEIADMDHYWHFIESYQR